MEEIEPAYNKRGVPRVLTIKGIELYYKEPPLKNDIYVYRCRKKQCKCYIKMDKNNDIIISNNSNISFTEINEHSEHDEQKIKLVENINKDEIRTEDDSKELAVKLIKANSGLRYS